jgi:ATP-dependent Lhr-like helicase
VASDAIGLSYEVTLARREVLLGATPEVTHSERVPAAFERLRAAHADEISPNGLVTQARPDGFRLWTWAGVRANATILAGLGLDTHSVENDYIDLPADVVLASANSDAVPNPGQDAVVGLKFSAALPSVLAARTLGERLAEPEGARELSLNEWFIAHAALAAPRPESPFRHSCRGGTVSRA